MQVEIPPGTKIGTHVLAGASDAELAFLRQLGIEYVRAHFPVGDDTAEHLARAKARLESAGLRIFSVVSLLYQAREIAFALPGRDEKLQRLAALIRNMGQLGLHTLEYDFFLYAPLPATGETTTRGAVTREFDLAQAATFAPAVEREVGEEEMWASYTHMMEVLLPVAEASGVRLALHPDDPPVPSLLGVARIFRDIEGYKRAMARFDSPAWGVLFCVGTWAEGGEAMGMDTCGALRFFAQHGKLFTVHFRNVTGPLPRFAETFIDNGYLDMASVMDTLQEVGFDGLAIPDHFPQLAGDEDGRASLAYSIGYMRGLLHQAEGVTT